MYDACSFSIRAVSVRPRSDWFTYWPMNCATVTFSPNTRLSSPISSWKLYEPYTSTNASPGFIERTRLSLLWSVRSVSHVPACRALLSWAAASSRSSHWVKVTRLMLEP